MKYRKDFVTNSSSSSYICDICGDNECGFDIGLSEAGMVQCVNGHTFCEDHIEIDDNKKLILLEEMCKDNDQEYSEVLRNANNKTILHEYLTAYNGRYDVEELLCPICSFEHGHTDDIQRYLMAKYHITEKSILAELKDRFKNYDSFKEFLKNK